MNYKAGTIDFSLGKYCYGVGNLKQFLNWMYLNVILKNSIVYYGAYFVLSKISGHSNDSIAFLFFDSITFFTGRVGPC